MFWHSVSHCHQHSPGRRTRKLFAQTAAYAHITHTYFVRGVRNCAHTRGRPPKHRVCNLIARLERLAHWHLHARVATLLMFTRRSRRSRILREIETAILRCRKTECPPVRTPFAICSALDGRCSRCSNLCVMLCGRPTTTTTKTTDGAAQTRASETGTVNTARQEQCDRCDDDNRCVVDRFHSKISEVGRSQRFFRILWLLHIHLDKIIFCMLRTYLHTYNMLYKYYEHNIISKIIICKYMNEKQVPFCIMKPCIFITKLIVPAHNEPYSSSSTPTLNFSSLHASVRRFTTATDLVLAKRGTHTSRVR